MSKTITVPTRFFDDHDDRGLFEGPVVVHGRTKARVTVEMTEADLADLASDAVHYALSIRDMPDERALCLSARDTVRTLWNQCVIFPASCAQDARRIATA